MRPVAVLLVAEQAEASWAAYVIGVLGVLAHEPETRGSLKACGGCSVLVSSAAYSEKRRAIKCTRFGIRLRSSSSSNAPPQGSWRSIAVILGPMPASSML